MITLDRRGEDEREVLDSDGNAFVLYALSICGSNKTRKKRVLREALEALCVPLVKPCASPSAGYESKQHSRDRQVGSVRYISCRSIRVSGVAYPLDVASRRKRDGRLTQLGLRCEELASNTLDQNRIPRRTQSRGRRETLARAAHAEVIAADAVRPIADLWRARLDAHHNEDRA